MARAALILGATLLFTVFAALGAWQLHRRTWKLALIAAVEARVAAAPTAAPGRADWSAINAIDDAYRRVTVVGSFLNADATRVQAVTALGGGAWVMVPLRAEDGFIVLVNRGFVPADPGVPVGEINGATRVTGLLRPSEPGGGFLRANDPGAGRWYSRDVAAIAQARGLAEVAPYFIDADAVPGIVDGPVGGLTVVRFPNDHLVYALTWFALAAMTAGGVAFLVRDDRRGRDLMVLGAGARRD